MANDAVMQKLFDYFKVMLEKIPKELQYEKYKEVWNSICDEMASDFELEGLIETAKFCRKQKFIDEGSKPLGHTAFYFSDPQLAKYCEIVSSLKIGQCVRVTWQEMSLYKVNSNGDFDLYDATDFPDRIMNNVIGSSYNIRMTKMDDCVEFCRVETTDKPMYIAKDRLKKL